MPHDFAKERDNNLEVTYRHDELAVTVAAGRPPNIDGWIVKVRGADVTNRRLGQFSTKRGAKEEMKRWMKRYKGPEETMGLGLGLGSETEENSSGLFRF